MPRLVIRLKRLSPTRHEFAYSREDGSGEAVSLETKTLLSHDLLHFAVETEAGLEELFYGKLAAGRSLAELKADAMGMQAGEAAVTERVVGALTGAIQSAATADHVVAASQRLEAALGGHGRPAARLVRRRIRRAGARAHAQADRRVGGHAVRRDHDPHIRELTAAPLPSVD